MLNRTGAITEACCEQPTMDSDDIISIRLLTITKFPQWAADVT